jgi:predicted dehydrogenase
MRDTRITLRRRADPLRVAVVGLGYWGPNIARNLHDLPETELAGLCDVRPQALEAMRLRYPDVPLTTDYNELVDDPSVDAVAIATPVSTHHELATAVLEAEKHVFIEKPLADSSEAAIDLVETARERGLVLMPGHTFIYSPAVNLIRDLIESGDLGEIYFISTSRVNLGLHQPDVSVAWDLGPHDFSILCYWLELPVRVSAISRSCILPTIADVAFINLEFRSGVIAHVELSWLAPSKLRRTTIVGSEKMVVYDDTSAEPVRVFDSGVAPPNPETFGEFQLSYRTGDVVSPRVDVAEPLALDFYEAIRTGRELRSSPALGVEVVHLVEAVDRSLRAGGAPVDVAARRALQPLSGARSAERS